MNEQLSQWRGDTGGVDHPLRPAVGGTVRALIAAYQASPQRAKLSPMTKYDHGWHLKAIDAWIGDQQAREITPVVVHDMIDALYDAGKHALANSRVRVLHRVYRVGRLKGLVADNPAAKQDLIYGARKAEPILWTDEMVAAFCETADAMGRHSVATSVLLNVWLGQREGDILALPVDAIRDGRITITQRKTGSTVCLPIARVPHLVERFAAEAERRRVAADAPVADPHAARLRREARGLLIVNEETGRGYTADNFRHVFRRICLAAQKRYPDLPLAQARFCWLRHSCVTRLAEAGCEISEIASVTGHEMTSVVSILEHYLCRTEEQADNAFSKRLQRLEQHLAGARP